MKPVSRSTFAILTAGLVLLTTREAVGGHLPPVTPVLPGEDHRHEDHSGTDFTADDLRNVNFSDGRFTGVIFEHARLDGTSFVAATLNGAILRTKFTNGANFTGASLVNARLTGMGGTGVLFTNANFSGVDMDDAFFYFSDFRNVNFAGADLGEFTAEDSDFRGADLSAAVNIDTLFPRSIYDSSTRFPAGYDAQGVGMILVPEPSTATLGLAGLIVAGSFRRRLRHIFQTTGRDTRSPAGAVVANLCERLNRLPLGTEERNAVERFLETSQNFFSRFATAPVVKALADGLIDGGDEARARTLDNAAEKWAAQNIGEARAWVEALPEGMAREYALAGVARGWANGSISEVVTWLDALPASRSRDAAVGGFARTLLARDPATAMAWMRTIPDSERRLSTLQIAWAEWMKRSPTEAAQWRDDSPDLTAAERSRLAVPQ